MSNPDLQFVRSSQALIEHNMSLPDPSLSPWADKVFITANPSVQTVAGQMPLKDYLMNWASQKVLALYLDIDHTTPVATLNNNMVDATELGAPIRTVPGIRSGNDRGLEWLISCGSLISDSDGHLVLFERTERAPNGKIIAWPKAMNNPMGRCDGLPSQIMIKEGAEELSILRHAFGEEATYHPMMIEYNGRRGIGLDHELRLQEKVKAELAKKGTAINFLGTETINATFDDRYADKVVSVVTRMGGQIVDEVKAAVAFSPSEQTIEMALPLRLDAVKGKLTYLSREPFGRETKRMTPEQLQAAHNAWARGLSGTANDDEQNRIVHLGGILPILQSAILGSQIATSDPSSVSVPAEWTNERIKLVLGM